VSYNFEGGTYVDSVPMITVNWKADGGNQWAVPLAGIRQIFHLGKLPMNTEIGAYCYNAKQYNPISHSLQADAVVPAPAWASKPLFGA